MSATPVFGSRQPDVSYTDRRAAYAVILAPDGAAVAAVFSRNHYFLPGGGSLPNEMPEQAVVREVREEMGRGVRLIRPIGEAIQYFYAATDDRHYRMWATFFIGELTDTLPPGSGEHELVYLPRAEAEKGFFHESHVWAIHQA